MNPSCTTLYQSDSPHTISKLSTVDDPVPTKASDVGVDGVECATCWCDIGVALRPIAFEATSSMLAVEQSKDQMCKCRTSSKLRIRPLAEHEPLLRPGSEPHGFAFVNGVHSRYICGYCRRRYSVGEVREALRKKCDTCGGVAGRTRVFTHEFYQYQLCSYSVGFYADRLLPMGDNDRLLQPPTAKTPRDRARDAVLHEEMREGSLITYVNFRM
jgi:hypothetical protein